MTTAIVTRGSSPIARSVAEDLVQQGSRVVLTDISLGQDEAISDEGALELFEADLMNTVDAEALARTASNRFGQVDTIVNVVQPPPFDDTSVSPFKDWADGIHDELQKLLNLLDATAPAMMRRQDGHVVNVIVPGEPAPLHRGTNLVAAFSVEALADGLQAELENYGVCVTSVQLRWARHNETAPTQVNADDIVKAVRVLVVGDLSTCVTQLTLQPRA